MISERLAHVKQVLAGQSVRLVAVTKYATVEQMREAYDAGIRCFGENRVQEALAKIALFPTDEYPDLRWHFIGHLQTNKVRKTLGRFELIHSLDSLPLAESVSRHNEAAGLRQDVLLQVNLQPDPERFGFDPAALDEAMAHLIALQGIHIGGLMTMAPPVEDASVVKGVFRGLRDLRNRLEDRCRIPLPELSMGMSQDFVHAIECGATIIRLGGYLFRD